MKKAKDSGETTGTNGSSGVPDYSAMGFRTPKKKKGAIYASNIGFRAPEHTRERLEWLTKCLSYSANRVVIEAIDAIYFEIVRGVTHTAEITMRGRDLKKYSPHPPHS